MSTDSSVAILALPHLTGKPNGDSSPKAKQVPQQQNVPTPPQAIKPNTNLSGDGSSHSSPLYASPLSTSPTVPNITTTTTPLRTSPRTMIITPPHVPSLSLSSAANGSTSLPKSNLSPRNTANSNIAPTNSLNTIGNYVIERTIGKGQFGKVKLGYHIKIPSEKVAIKIVNKSKLEPDTLAMVSREVRIMKLLSHPNVIRLYEVIETPKALYLVLEWASGGEVMDLIIAHGRMQEKEARRYFVQMMSAVQYCHSKRVLHRDLKPENLLLDSNMNIKIIDFGLGNVFTPGMLMKTFCGSPTYASPELILRKAYNGPPVDVWSMGVVLYVLVCGYLPFDGAGFSELFDKILACRYTIPQHVSRECASLIQRMLVIDPAQRATIDELRQHPWITQGPVSIQAMLTPPPLSIIDDPQHMDPEILTQLEFIGFTKDDVIESVINERYDDAAATYFLLESRKHRKRSFGAPISVSSSISSGSLMSSNQLVAPEIRVTSRGPSGSQPQQPQQHQLAASAVKPVIPFKRGHRRLHTTDGATTSHAEGPGIHPLPSSDPMLQTTSPGISALGISAANSSTVRSPNSSPRISTTAASSERRSKDRDRDRDRDKDRDSKDRDGRDRDRDKDKDKDKDRDEKDKERDIQREKEREMAARTRRSVMGFKIHRRAASEATPVVEEETAAPPKSQSPIRQSKEGSGVTETTSPSAVPLRRSITSGQQYLSPSPPAPLTHNIPRSSADTEEDWVHVVSDPRSDDELSPRGAAAKAASTPQKSAVGSLLTSVKSLFSSPKADAHAMNVPVEPRTLRFAFSADTTTTKSAEYLMQELHRVLLLTNTKYNQSEPFMVECESGNLHFEMEVCRLPRLSLNGLRIKRRGGSSWEYKEICKNLVSQMRL